MRFFKLIKNHYIKIALTFGLFLIFLLIYKVGISNLLNTVKEMNVILLLLSVFPLILYIILTSYRWQCLLAKKNVHVPLSDLFRATCIGYFYSIITPTQVGTLAKMLYLRDKSIKKEVLVLTTLTDKFLEAVSLLIIASIGTLMFVHSRWNNYIYGFSIIFILVGLSTGLLDKSLFGRLAVAIYNFVIPSDIKSRYGTKIKNLYRNIPTLGESFYPLIISLFAWVTVYTCIYLISLSVNLGVSFPVLVSALSFSSVIGLIPITVSGIGTREAALLLVLGEYTASPEKILGMSIVSFIIARTAPALAGAVYLWLWEKDRLRD